jgi:alcohol dehydrogenase (cytochrome c)
MRFQERDLIKRYYHPLPTPTKIALLLGEAGLEYKAFLPVSPNGKTPALTEVARCLAVAASFCVASAQAADALRAASFTPAQAEAGGHVYTAHCAACHGATLANGSAPALVGQQFQAAWAGPRRPLRDLFGYVTNNMPLGAGRSLPRLDYVDVVAFLLEANGQPPGTQMLTADDAALSQVYLAVSAPPLPAPVRTALQAGLVQAAAMGPAPGAGPTQADLLGAAASGQDWLTSNRDYGGQRYSPLKGIDRANVSRLREVCSFTPGRAARFQTFPVVHDGTMYFTSALSTLAIDAATCALRWRHDWSQTVPGVETAANRGVAIADGRVVRGTADGYLLALNSMSGKLLWARRVSNPALGELITMPPLIYGDLVFIAPAVSEFNIQGWIGAFRVSDGEPVWRFNIVPKPGEAGAETWNRHPTVPVGGGSVWTPLSFDPAHELLYVPAANPAPDFAAALRGGDNLYTNSVLALHARTGKLAWYKQVSPHDSHDWDVTQVSPLYHATVGGVTRDLVTEAGKDGVLRVFDRDSHLQMFQAPLTTIRNADLPVTEAGVDVCPGALGGVQWNGAAYAADADLLVAPAVDWCSHYVLDHEVEFVPFRTYLGGASPMITQARGWLTAVDASTGAVRWRYHSERPMIAAVTATAGGLVFAGELTGDLLAFDSANGAVLFRHNVGEQLGAGIVTYAVAGRQYVAAAAGTPSAYWLNPPGGAPEVHVFALEKIGP